MKNKKIYYGKAVYDSKEINAVMKVLKKNSLNLIDGPHVKKLEKKLVFLHSNLTCSNKLIMSRAHCEGSLSSIRFYPHPSQS